MTDRKYDVFVIQNEKTPKELFQVGDLENHNGVVAWASWTEKDVKLYEAMPSPTELFKLFQEWDDEGYLDVDRSVLKEIYDDMKASLSSEIV